MSELPCSNGKKVFTITNPCNSSTTGLHIPFPAMGVSCSIDIPNSFDGVIGISNLCTASFEMKLYFSQRSTIATTSQPPILPNNFNIRGLVNPITKYRDISGWREFEITSFASPDWELRGLNYGSSSSPSNVCKTQSSLLLQQCPTEHLLSHL